MEEEIAFENGRISHFQGLLSLTLTSDWITLCHSLTATDRRTDMDI